MTHSLGRNHFVASELAVGWLVGMVAGNKNMRTSHLSQLQISLAQLFYISVMIQLNIPHSSLKKGRCLNCPSKQLQLYVFVYSALKKIEKTQGFGLLCLWGRSGVLILAAVDPYLEMSPGRFQFIIMVVVGGGGR